MGEGLPDNVTSIRCARTSGVHPEESTLVPAYALSRQGGDLS